MPVERIAVVAFNLAAVAYIAREARQELLDTLGEATDEIAVALAALGAAYEQLGTMPADGSRRSSSARSRPRTAC